MTSLTSAIAAYASAAKIPGEGGAAATAESSLLPGQDFSSMLKDAAASTIQATRASEEMSKAAITGKADVRDVVMAVSDAEMTLQTVVAVRDKVVTAYQEILRMPI